MAGRVAPGTYSPLDDLLYLPCTNGVDIVDVSEPASPEKMSTYPRNISRTFAESETAYFFGGKPPLAVVDVSDPSNPVTLLENEVMIGEASAGCSDGVVQGNIVFMLYQQGNEIYLVTYDIGDLANPTPLGFCQLGEYEVLPRLIRANGGIAAATTYGRVFIVDISEPANPSVLHELEPCSEKTGVHLHGKYLFTTGCQVTLEFGNYLQVYDISGPSNPQALANATEWGDPWNVHVAHGYAFVADQNAGLLIYDVRGCW